MNDRRFNVIFSGDMAFDIERTEIVKNLREKCKYSQATIDKLLSGQQAILKKELPYEKAQRYKAFFDDIGVLCDVIAVHQETEAAAPANSNLQQKVEPAPTQNSRTCPKCQTGNQHGESCQHCGVIFARYAEVQARRQDQAFNPATALVPPEESYFDSHPEQLFILKACLTIVLILLVKNFLQGWLSLFLLLFPVFFFLYLHMQASVTGQSSFALLREHVTLMPIMYGQEERKQQYVPVATYSLIAINILIFYLLETSANATFIANNLIFLPFKPTIVNVPGSLLSYMFLHANQGHLWGNMLFLWAVGTMVERRIGTRLYLTLYLVSGIGAGLLYLVTCLIMGWPAHLLGASGAIAGIMGVFAVRCYFKTMVFPLPILGLLSFILPLSLKVKLNSLIIIGLFFLADLSSGLGQLQGTNHSNIGHWAHIGGIICGTLLAMLFKINKDAITERHIELGSQAVNNSIGSGDTDKGEESLRLLLKNDPANSEALLLLARLRSKFSASEEADQLYQQVIPKLVQTDAEQAMLVYHEYYQKYFKGLDPTSMYRLAQYFSRAGDLESAVQCLEHVCQNQQTATSVLEKSLFQCARLLEDLQMYEGAYQYYQRCIRDFPQSTLADKANKSLLQSVFLRFNHT